MASRTESEPLPTDDEILDELLREDELIRGTNVIIRRIAELLYWDLDRTDHSLSKQFERQVKPALLRVGAIWPRTDNGGHGLETTEEDLINGLNETKTGPGDHRQYWKNIFR